MSSIASDNRTGDQAMTGAEDTAVSNMSPSTNNDVPSPTAANPPSKQSVPSMQTPGHPSFRRLPLEQTNRRGWSFPMRP
ncbi:hypothetical protein ACJ72_05955 [Emergomyces africanus]|uniref:Uncharacterized protein n=1 Tax=Emergomyces africanus TaxID=1955775 RepID=A0A1B7NSV2_9EURO|nr:hypothetical protein ACJ72_05955 [Emergomyces africanus]